GSLNYNTGGGTGDLINLAGSSGNATINAFSFGSGADTINASNGADTVFGGANDRIAAGTAGTLLADHSTTVAGASVGFGVNAASGSTANVTVTNFSQVG